MPSLTRRLTRADRRAELGLVPTHPRITQQEENRSENASRREAGP